MTVIKKEYLIIITSIISITLIILPSFPLTIDIYLPQTFLPKTQVPIFLKPGDILFCDLKTSTIQLISNSHHSSIQTFSGYSNDHCLMYIGNNKFIESCPYYARSEPYRYTGVVITPYEVVLLWATNITFGTINTSQHIRDKAITWAKQQLGTPYGGLDGLYCGELIWHAYDEQGLFLSYTPNPSYPHTYAAKYPWILNKSENVSLYSIKNT